MAAAVGVAQPERRTEDERDTQLGTESASFDSIRRYVNGRLIRLSRRLVRNLDRFHPHVSVNADSPRPVIRGAMATFRRRDSTAIRVMKD